MCVLWACQPAFGHSPMATAAGSGSSSWPDLDLLGRAELPASCQRFTESSRAIHSSRPTLLVVFRRHTGVLGGGYPILAGGQGSGVFPTYGGLTQYGVLVQ
jgi:hypothetical protein